MEDMVYYFTFAVTTILCLAIMIKIGLRASAENAKSVKVRILLGLNLVGILSGTLLFHSLVWLLSFLGFSVSLGHGEVVIAVLLFNVLIAFSISLVGAILLPWKSLQW
jgi:hypothetical protein